MMTEQQVLSKGFYQYSQFNDFVSVKNYIFLRQAGKKCLLIRFSNDMEFTVNRLFFTILQLDAAGKVLDRTAVELDGVHIQPGGVYVPREGIVVAEGCNDFKILYDEVRSGRYSYKICNGQVVASYICPQKPLLPAGKKGNTRRAVHEFSVNTKRYSKPKSTLAWTIVLVVLMILFNLGHLALLYMQEMDWWEDPIELIFGPEAAEWLDAADASVTPPYDVYGDGML